ncbi:MAG: hypothetical protein RMJ88_02345 [Thermogemmata sp.]|nr:hypothetical protein [Thermogemmata sp.]
MNPAESKRNMSSSNAVSTADKEVVKQFLDAVAAANGISRAEAEQLVLLDAARRWQQSKQSTDQLKPIARENQVPTNPMSLTILLVVAGILAVLAGMIFVLTK